MRRRTFTLTEMLVVMAIIAILTTMLSPALAGSRRQASDSACRSNLRQMGVSLYLYRADNDGRMPTGETSGEIFEALYEEGYLESTELLSCPASPVEDVNFDSEDGVSYLIDINMPEDRAPKRAVMADKVGNHSDGVINVLFEDGSVESVDTELGKAQNPHIDADINIFEDTGDPRKHANISWVPVSLLVDDFALASGSDEDIELEEGEAEKFDVGSWIRSPDSGGQGSDGPGLHVNRSDFDIVYDVGRDIKAFDIDVSDRGDFDGFTVYTKSESGSWEEQTDWTLDDGVFDPAVENGLTLPGDDYTHAWTQSGTVEDDGHTRLKIEIREDDYRHHCFLHEVRIHYYEE